LAFDAVDSLTEYISDDNQLHLDAHDEKNEEVIGTKLLD